MSKRTIPRFAIATLALGGACDNDGDGNQSTSRSLEPVGINATESRVDDVASALCKRYNECAPDEFRSDYTSVSACSRELGDTISALEAGEVCKDALLDFYGCYAKLSCSEIDDNSRSSKALEDCSALYDQATEVCPEGVLASDGDDYDYDDYDYDDYDY